MNLFDTFTAALPYSEFMARHGTPAYADRWRATYDKVQLTPAQRDLLGQFQRQTNVLVLAGAWCGDCSGQCPIFDRFAEAAPDLTVRYLDRDAHPDVQAELRINGGDRVPVVVFFSEDGYEVARYGERTLSRYRALAATTIGASCPTGLAAAGDPLLAAVTQDWLDEFERVQWILRLSPRLRQKHRD
ncbi:MAG TPA: thioredoxin family protein [Gemmataceae bacterium]|jgi:thiol-disulfide isomerase/thioredoxin